MGVYVDYAIYARLDDYFFIGSSTDTVISNEKST